MPLVAAARWYELLLARGGDLEALDVAASIPAFALAWLPEHLQPAVRQLLAAGLRLPQELVGWEQLRGMTSWVTTAANEANTSR